MQPYSFSTNDVLAATGWTMNTFQSHMRREDTIVSDGVTEARRGVPRRFTWNAIMQFVIGGELIAMGITPNRAFFYAAKVAFIGAALPLDAAGEQGVITRAPGYPFPYQAGETWVLIANEKLSVVATLGNKLDLSAVPDLWGAAVSFQALNLTKLFEKTCQSLELDAASQLNSVYA